MPVFQFTSNARPALFAYPAPVQAVTTTQPKKVAAAVLSTTARAAKRKAEKERLKSGAAPMEGVVRLLPFVLYVCMNNVPSDYYS